MFKFGFIVTTCSPSELNTKIGGKVRESRITVCIWPNLPGVVIYCCDF